MSAFAVWSVSRRRLEELFLRHYDVAPNCGVDRLVRSASTVCATRQIVLRAVVGLLSLPLGSVYITKSTKVYRCRQAGSFIASVAASPAQRRTMYSNIYNGDSVGATALAAEGGRLSRPDRCRGDPHRDDPAASLADRRGRPRQDAQIPLPSALRRESTAALWLALRRIGCRRFDRNAARRTKRDMIFPRPEFPWPSAWPWPVPGLVMLSGSTAVAAAVD